MSVIQAVMRAHLQYGQACTVQHVTIWLTLSMFAVLVLRLNPGCLVGCPGSMAAGSLAMFFICSSGAPCSVDLALLLPPDASCRISCLPASIQGLLITVIDYNAFECCGPLVCLVCHQLLMVALQTSFLRWHCSDLHLTLMLYGVPDCSNSKL